MSRRRLIIPGTGGVLFEANGKQVGSVFDLLTRPSQRKVLGCRHSPKSSVLAPLATSGKPNVKVSAVGHMSAAYAPMDHAVPGWTFWDYDWRLDMRFSGQRLARFLTEQAPKGDRWHVVTHSQGGLVLLWAGLALGADELARLVHSVVFVGVPFHGTFNALEALTEGYFIKRSIPVELARTWPSLYQMLPRWSLHGRDLRRPTAFLNATWDNAGLFPPGAGAVDLTRYIDPSLLARGRAWQAATESHLFEPLSKLRYIRIIFGRGEPTRVGVSAFPKLKPAQTEDGDSLVPDELTYSALPGWVRDEANIKRFVAGEHSLLCSDPNVYDWCV
jgi:pimeloyl-ACP methyl ester carboxylesterase